MVERVTVFVDYQNVHHSGHERYCAIGDEMHKCVFDPLRLAEAIVAQRPPGGVLEAVRVYRGRPDPRKEPTLASANDQQFSEWIKDPRVTVKRRMLQYPRDWGQPDCAERPREKGIDVSLAIDLVRMAFKHEFEVAIVVSRDSDLEPALEMVKDLRLGHVEVAGWERDSRLRGGRYYHALDERVFRSSRDTRPYSRPR
jgi:uncharacterized LabA/DUF88 family protein